MLRLAEVEVGAAFEADTAAIIEKRLRATGKFREGRGAEAVRVDCRSVDSFVVIVVDEGDVKIEWDQDSGAAPRTVRRRGPGVMFLPVLDVQDGYGWTYGVRFAVPNVAGSRSRVAFPLTWGGDKRAAVQFEKDFDTGPLDCVTGGLSRLPARAPVLRTRRRSTAAVGEGGARSAAEASSRGNRSAPNTSVPGRRHPVHADRRRPRARHASRSRARAQCGLRPRRLGPLRGHRSGAYHRCTASTSAATRA